MFKEGETVLYIDENITCWGIVEVIEKDPIEVAYPIKVRIIKDNCAYSFTKDGFRYSTEKIPRIEPLPKELLRFPRVMEVKDVSEKTWKKRVVIGIKNGLAVAWVNATNMNEAEISTSTTTWTQYREIEEEDKIEEFTLEEVAKALGKDVNKIRIKK